MMRRLAALTPAIATAALLATAATGVTVTGAASPAAATAAAETATGPAEAAAGDATAAELERARQALAPLKKGLLRALSRALAEGGPEASIAVCRDQAPAIAAEAAAAGGGIELGRTSHRVRNPANAPAPWIEPLLAAYLGQGNEGRPHSVRFDDGRLGYVEPIYTASLCLRCHGDADQLTPEVRQRLQTLYPDDQATGFSEGDLRGLFWVVLPAPGAGPTQE